MQPYSSSIDTVGGSALRNASVAVKLNGVLATIYDLDGVEQANPMTTDSTGSFSFRAANGEYQLEISRVGIVPRTETVLLYDPEDDASSPSLADYDDLRGYSGNRKSVYVTGYLASATPSGVAGLFTRDDDDTTSADDGGMVIVASNGARWKRVRSDEAADLAWFGAALDGVTDDASALEAALASGYRLRGNGTCYVGSAVAVSGPIRISAGGLLTIEGAGSGALFAHTGTAIECDGVEFRNFTNVVSKTSPVALETLSYTFDRCTFEAITGNPINVTGGQYNLKNCRFERNRFVNCASGISIYAATSMVDVQVRGNYFESINRANNSETHAIRLILDLGSSPADPDTTPIAQEQTHGVIVTGNVIKDVRNTADYVGGYTTGIMVIAGHGIVTGNTIHTVKNNGVTDGVTAFGIYCKLLKGVVSNNVLFDAGSFTGVSLKSYRSDETGYTFNGRTGKLIVQGNTIHYESVTPKDDISLRVEGDYSIVSGNQLSGTVASLSIEEEVNGTRNHDNIVTANSLVSDTFVLMFVRGDNSTVTGNHLHYKGTAAMRAPGGSTRVAECVGMLMKVGASKARADAGTYKNIVVTNNTLTYDGADRAAAGSRIGVLVRGSDAATIHYENLRISGNTFTGAKTPVHTAGTGSTFDRLIIQNNSNDYDATAWGADASTYTNVYVDGNIGCGPKHSGRTTKRSTGGTIFYEGVDAAGARTISSSFI